MVLTRVVLSFILLKSLSTGAAFTTTYSHRDALPSSRNSVLRHTVSKPLYHKSLDSYAHFSTGPMYMTQRNNLQTFDLHKRSPHQHGKYSIGNVKQFMGQLFSKMKAKGRKGLLSLLVFMSFTLFAFGDVANARYSGGRMGGGSFRSTSYSRPSYSSPRGTLNQGSYSGHRNHGIYTPAPHSSSSTRLSGTRPSNDLRTASDLPQYKNEPVVWKVVYPVSFVGLIYYNAFNERKDKDVEINSSLGPGVSVLKLTFAFDISNRHDPDCLLEKLKDIAGETDTSSKKGIQVMLSEVCKAILKEQSTIYAVTSDYEHFSTINDAERSFRTFTIKERSKFMDDSINNYNGENSNSLDINTGSDDETAETSAVVSIVLAIEGNKTKPRSTTITAWQDVWGILSLVSSNAMVDECLLSTEVLWSPVQSSDVMTRKDLAAFYPDLRII